MKMDIQGTTILEDLLNYHVWDTAVLEGSSRSSKTFSIIQFLVIYALQHPGCVIRGLRNDGTTCNKTIVKDFHEIMRHHFAEEWNEDNYNKQEKRYRFGNGAEFYFDGTMDIGKLHGQSQDVAWFNEVMEIKHDAFTQVEMRTRDKVLMDFNPSISSHWVFTSILTRDKGVYYSHSTYQNNPFLTPKQIAAIERLEPTPENVKQGTANEWKWRVYGRGERAGREGRIYTNYRQTDAWPDEHLCMRHGFGLDFGFSSDPTALVECALFQDELYLRLHVYETQLLTTKPTSRPATPSLEVEMEKGEIPKSKLIVADNARPESIAELQTAGYNVIPCTKGKDSVVNGIQLLQGFTLVVHRQSQKIIEELENYTWDKHNATGQWLDQPIDEYNHALDAARYWAMHNLRAHQIQPRSTKRLPRQADTGGSLL